MIILDPNLDSRWPKNGEGGSVFLTSNTDAFIKVVKDPENTGSIVVVDESGEKIGRYGAELAWLGTRARHYGHQCMFITQRATQLDTSVRTQCANVFIFRQGSYDAKILAAEIADSSGVVMQAATLNQGEFISCVGMQQPKRLRLTI